MNRGPGSRPLLPQTTPMQTFQLAPPNIGLGDTKKSESRKTLPYTSVSIDMLTTLTDYVFVDEHNRHKRLKGTQSLLFRTTRRIELTQDSYESL